MVAVLGYLYMLTPLFAALAMPGPQLPPTLVARLVVLGALGLVALWWRQRHPLAVALIIAVLSIGAPSLLGAAVVAQQSLALREPRRWVTLAVGAAMILAKIAQLLPSGISFDTSSTQVELGLTIFGVVVATLIGWLRSSLRDARGSRADAEYERQQAIAARIEQARLAERERIAREMHDVVAHRISLVAMHSGVLAHRTDLDGAQVQEVARLIQSNAQASLDELRAMLATLRGADTPPEAPQPSLEELPVLLAEAREAGQQIEFESVGEFDSVPQQISRHAFRIVQEAITNARKHAPGAPVDVRVAVEPEQLSLKVSNPIADLAPRDESGSGLGLVGIQERVGLLGGTVQHGARDGRFTLSAHLPLRPGRETGA